MKIPRTAILTFIIVIVFSSIASLANTEGLPPNFSMWIVLLAKGLSSFGKALHNLLTSWPFILFILFVIFFVRHRVAINELLGRIEGGSVSLGNLKTTFEAPNREPASFDKEHILKGKRVSPEITIAQRLYNETIELSEKGKYDLAIQKLQRANEVFPDALPILHALGYVCLRSYLKSAKRNSYDVENAERYIQRAIDIYPLERIPGTLYNLARSQALQNKRDAIKGTFEAFKRIEMPKQLTDAIKEEPDFENIRDMQEFEDIISIQQVPYI